MAMLAWPLLRPSRYLAAPVWLGVFVRALVVRAFPATARRPAHPMAVTALSEEASGGTVRATSK